MVAKSTLVLSSAGHEIAGKAAQWAVAFYPDVTIVEAGEKVILESETRSELELRLILAAAVTNEKLLEAGRTPRADVLEALLK